MIQPPVDGKILGFEYSIFHLLVCLKETLFHFFRDSLPLYRSTLRFRDVLVLFYMRQPSCVSVVLTQELRFKLQL
jgi:hypothetical protein